MIRVCKNDYNNRLIFQPIEFTSFELDLLEKLLIQYYGSITNIPKYTYIDLSFIRQCLQLDMLEGVVYVDYERIEDNLNRLFGGKEK